MRHVSKLAFAAVLAIAAPMTVSAAPNNPNAAVGGPNNPPSSTEPPCEYAMGHLRMVTVKQVGAIDDDWRVWIRPVCEYSPHAPVRNLGNATQLIGAIGRNVVLEAALDEKRYLADDVVGVELTKGQRVILWVHPSLY